MDVFAQLRHKSSGETTTIHQSAPGLRYVFDVLLSRLACLYRLRNGKNDVESTYSEMELARHGTECNECAALAGWYYSTYAIRYRVLSL